MYDINMLGGGHPALPPPSHYPHHPHVIPHPHPHMLPHPQQQHAHPHSHPLQHQMVHAASANRAAGRHHFEGHRGTGSNSIIPPPCSNVNTHSLGLTATSSGNSGVTTFYRTISADNKSTTIVIGPSKKLQFAYSFYVVLDTGIDRKFENGFLRNGPENKSFSVIKQLLSYIM